MVQCTSSLQYIIQFATKSEAFSGSIFFLEQKVDILENQFKFQDILVVRLANIVLECETPLSSSPLFLSRVNIEKILWEWKVESGKKVLLFATRHSLVTHSSLTCH